MRGRETSLIAVGAGLLSMLLAGGARAGDKDLSGPISSIEDLQDVGKFLSKLADTNNDNRISQKEAVDAGNLIAGGFFSPCRRHGQERRGEPGRVRQGHHQPGARTIQDLRRQQRRPDLGRRDAQRDANPGAGIAFNAGSRAIEFAFAPDSESEQRTVDTGPLGDRAAAGHGSR